VLTPACYLSVGVRHILHLYSILRGCSFADKYIIRLTRIATLVFVIRGRAAYNRASNNYQVFCVGKP
jgi:hypothetical protein